MLKVMVRRDFEAPSRFDKRLWVKRIAKMVVGILGALFVISLIVPPSARLGYVFPEATTGGRVVVEYPLVNDGFGLVLSADVYIPLPTDVLSGASYPQLHKGTSSPVISSTVSSDELASVGMDPRAIPDGYTVAKFKIGVVGATWMFWMNTGSVKLVFDFGYPPTWEGIPILSGVMVCRGPFVSAILELPRVNVTAS
jgi:hypothetical protein